MSRRSDGAITIAALTALALGTVLVSCSDDDPPTGTLDPSPVPSFNIGAEAQHTLDDMQIAISQVNPRATVEMNSLSGANSELAGAENIWILVSMNVSNTSEVETHDVNQLECTLKGQDDRIYAASGVTPFEASGLPTILYPLDTAAGWQCAFPVPPLAVGSSNVITVSSTVSEGKPVSLPLFVR